MQSNNTRPNQNTKFGSNQSEAEETHTHTHEPSVSKEERERFNSVGQSKEKRREEKRR